MLGDDIHAHEGKPRYQNTAVECDPIVLEKSFVCQQIHADDADDEKRDGDCRNGFQQNSQFFLFSFQFLFDVHMLKVLPFFAFSYHYTIRKMFLQSYLKDFTVIGERFYYARGE